MKNIVILLLFANAALAAQTTFVTEIGDSKTRTIPHYAIETEDGHFIIAGAKGKNASTGQTNEASFGAYIVLLDSVGHLITENWRQKKDTIWACRYAEQLPSGNYRVLSTVQPDDTLKHNNYILTTEYDSNLQLLDEHKYIIPDTTKVLSQVYAKIHNDILYCFGNFSNQGGMFVFKIQSDGSASYYDNIDNSIYDIVITEEGRLFATIKTDKKYLAELDTIDYSVINSLKMSDLEKNFLFLGYRYELYQDESENLTLQTTIGFHDHGLVTQGLFVFDKNLNIIGLFTPESDIESANLGNWHYDFIEPNYRYLAGQQLALSPYYVVRQIDENYSLKQETFLYFPDNWVFVGIHATHDMGTLAIAVSTTDNTFHIRAIKFNSDVQYTGNPELPVRVTELLPYPNPGTNQLNIRTAVQATGGTFSLYDIQGRLVLSQNISDTHSTINTSALAPGSYIYQYVLEGELRESGKWIKN